jgi:hypothetical protein
MSIASGISRRPANERKNFGGMTRYEKAIRPSPPAAPIVTRGRFSRVVPSAVRARDRAFLSSSAVQRLTSNRTAAPAQSAAMTPS